MIVFHVEKNKAGKGDKEYWGSCIFTQDIRKGLTEEDI